MADGSLSGVRVLDLSRVWAGPLATRLLGDLGAEVIKIESVQRADGRGPAELPLAVPWPGGIYPAEKTGEHPWNRAGIFNKLNRNKLGITLNLSAPEGVAIFKSLVRISEVVIENYTPRVMKNFGLDYPELERLNSTIIMVSLPGFGCTGPYRDYLSLGTVIESSSGIASLMGYEGGPPHLAGVSFPDAAGALNAAAAILVALFHRRRTGRGQFIDLSQSEAATSLIGEEILGYVMNGTAPPRRGNHHPYLAPHGCYRCRGEDEWVAIAVASDEEWQSLCQAMGSPAWSKDERFADALGRWRNRTDLDALIEDWTRERGHHEVMELLQNLGVRAGAVLDSQEMLNNVHLRERGFYIDISHPEAGTFPYPGLPIRMSETPCQTWKHAPGLGEDNEHVLGKLLGLTAPEIQHLSERQIIGNRPAV